MLSAVRRCELLLLFSDYPIVFSNIVIKATVFVTD